MMNREPARPATSFRRAAGRFGGPLAMLAILLIAGCSKKQPPPPPPPPPPPANVKLEDLAQELKVDARVQVASGLEVTESDVDMARAIIKFADALARGDAKAARSMMTRPAQAILDDLETNLAWENETAKFEAVRIVGIEYGINFGAPPAEPTANPAASGMQDMLKAALANVPDDQKQMVQQMLGSMAQDPAAMTAALDQAISSAKTAGLPDALITQLETMKNQLAAAGDAAAAASAPTGESGTGVLFAVQDPSGSYLLGWQLVQVNGTWMFANAATNSGERPRASGWDGIGPAGFADGPTLAADAPGDANKPGSLQPTEPSAPAAPADEPSGGGGRKNTPAGPITVPGGG